MKLIDLMGVVHDNVTIYEDGTVGGLFVDLYKGDMSNLPDELRNRTVASIGAARKRVVDIRVENE